MLPIHELWYAFPRLRARFKLQQNQKPKPKQTYTQKHNISIAEKSILKAMHNRILFFAYCFFFMSTVFTKLNASVWCALFPFLGRSGINASSFPRPRDSAVLPLSFFKKYRKLYLLLHVFTTTQFEKDFQKATHINHTHYKEEEFGHRTFLQKYTLHEFGQLFATTHQHKLVDHFLALRSEHNSES